MVILTNFIAFCILLRKTRARSGAGLRSGACACCMPYSLPGALCWSAAECTCWQAWQCFVGAAGCPFSNLPEAFLISPAAMAT